MPDTATTTAAATTTDGSPRDRLADARLYLCTDARKRQGDLPEFLDAVLAGGVDIVQLRDKGMEAAEELEHLAVFADACARHGKLLAVNDRADVAHAARADVLHLGQGDLPVPAARAILGAGVLVGRSTHAESEAAAAATQDGVDYFCTGPCWPTPTKPGRPAPGLGLVRYAAGLRTDRPWFAIGGIDLDNLDQVLDAGARRAVVVRALTEADDPGAAAAEFAQRLRSAPAVQGMDK
ncbi:thiamine phosphate synthase [Streptomyces griseoviridis]|uniref:Thiamine-phosphate synthase n=3 Tax=Streptomyces TaxID=1883 RepID=A0A918L9D6_STRGD|nr:MULTISPECIES: thiamine phosphate synthase [Streptomyces]MDP9681290.1 thiamine-phosphate pyrophosphorylase [Streptomyces griseoviridis]GGS21996.1 thiamine-phosphate synthase [Streptomyces niveoruber]GGS75745.1 thiamine-phosphate synthase [Streptomyces griseoviridis]GGU37015.1 thiamine-phosphate synthase [Streptomyces daghestanicus]GHI34710.1 thiamine-phosphate synthase [Streptomyces daghestanicus]